MTRIITPELNKKLKREYRLRFFAVLFLALGLVVFVHIMLALSSYILLGMYEQTYQKSLQSNNGEVLKQYEGFVNRTSALISLSKKISQVSDISGIEVFEKIKSYSSNQISIKTFEFYASEGKRYITLRGEADTRDTLIDFEDRMKKDVSFVDFIIPLEILTKQRDISFDVTLIYHEN